MRRGASSAVLFAGLTVFALSCAGPTRAPLDLGDASQSSTGGSGGSGGTSTGGVFGDSTGGALGTGGAVSTGGVFGADTGGASGTADAGGGEPRDAGRGDGGRRFGRDGGFGGGSDGGRRRDGGTAGQCPMGTRSGEPCMTMGMMCTSMGGGVTRNCVCRDDNGDLTWRCQRQ